MVNFEKYNRLLLCATLDLIPRPRTFVTINEMTCVKNLAHSKNSVTVYSFPLLALALRVFQPENC